MARPSLGSQYFQEVANKASARRQSSLHESWNEHNNNRSKTQSPIYTHSKSERENENPEVDSLKLKYLVQNKSLAQQNSAMSSKLSDMESKISDLINENMSLRKGKSVHEIDFKKHLGKKLLAIERNLIAKFDEVFQTLKNIRSEEGLVENPQLDILDELTRPTTSTPIDDSRRISGFGDPFEPIFNAHMISSSNNTKLVLPSSHKELGELTFPPSANDKTQTSSDRSNIRQRSPESKINASSLFDEKDESDHESIVEVSERVNDTIMGISDSTTRCKGDSAINEMEKQQLLPDSLSKLDNKFNVFRDSEKESKEVVIINKPAVNTKKKQYTKQKSIEGQTYSITDKDQMQEPSKQGQKAPLTQKLTVELGIKNEIEKKKEGDGLVAVNENPVIKRSTRNRKNIDYTVSLRKKLRRESEKFVDAVDGFIPQIGPKIEKTGLESLHEQEKEESSDERKRATDIIHLSVNEHTNSDKTANTTSMKRKQDQIQEASKKVKRKPLSNISNSSQNMRSTPIKHKGKLRGEPESEISIFDFTDDDLVNTKAKPRTKLAKR